MSTLADKLREARAFIDTPEKWTQGANARDAVGLPVPVSARGAVCFCSAGAVIRAVPSVDFSSAASQLVEAAGIVSFTVEHGLTVWNDDPERTHAEVLAAFDRAIEAAQATT